MQEGEKSELLFTSRIDSYLALISRLRAHSAGMCIISYRRFCLVPSNRRRLTIYYKTHYIVLSFTKGGSNIIKIEISQNPSTYAKALLILEHLYGSEH